MTWNIQHGSGYLLCFDKRFGKPRPTSAPAVAKFSYATHYLGMTDGIRNRISDHDSGHGSKLTRHVRRAGIGWAVTRTWEDANRDEEIRLKAPGAGHWCPRCSAERVMKRDPVYREVMAQALTRFEVALEAAEAERIHAATKSAGTRLWNSATRQAREQFRETRRQAGADWLAAHSKPGLRRESLACVLEDKPVASLSLVARRTAAYREQQERARADGQLADPNDPWSGQPPDLPAAEPEPRQLVAATAMPRDPWAFADAEAG